jgi:hypothetical protein
MDGTVNGRTEMRREKKKIQHHHSTSEGNIVTKDNTYSDWTTLGIHYYHNHLIRKKSL